jgi:hypothetical protein
MRRLVSGSVALALSLLACSPQAGDPGALIGTWKSDTPPVTLAFGEHSFRLESGTLTKWGTAERTPFRIAFVLERTSSPAFDLYCRGRVNVYGWRIEDGALAFRAVGRPCDRAARTVLVAGRWRRVGG